jgi:class 3 adenylate cyclase
MSMADTSAALETLAALRELRVERSTSAFIRRRIGSSMGERCSSGFGAI